MSEDKELKVKIDVLPPKRTGLSFSNSDETNEEIVHLNGRR